jgi:predicted TIM-barrel fold metal-dependent hydrolase
MMTIDADAHVIECERTWTYVEKSRLGMMPKLVTEAGEDGSARQHWVLEGRAHGRANVGLATTSQESREMADIDARLKHMDELEIDVQVLYPSLFLRPLTRRPEVDLALCQSYNRWLADIWSQSNNRLRWTVVPPIMSMDETLKEIRWAKDNGACGIFMLGIELDLTLDNPYFFPLYEAACDLDLPLGIHAGNNSFFWNDMFGNETGYSRAKMPVVSAFHSLLFSGIPTRFPTLRVGFIEAASQWVPGAIHDCARRLERRRGQPYDRFSVLEENRFYVTCQTDDDLAYILKYAGGNNLMIGTDYGHNDTATEIEALRYLKNRGEVAPATISRILGDNAKTLYGL